LDGLDEKIGVRPDSMNVAAVQTPIPTPTPTPEKLPENLPLGTTEPTPTPSPETTPTPEISPTPVLENKTETVPQPEITPSRSPTPQTEETPTPLPTPTEIVQPTPETNPTPQIKPEIVPTPETSVSSEETKNEPNPQTVSEVKNQPKQQFPSSPETKSDENKETPKIEEKPTPKPLFEPVIITIPSNSNSPQVKTEEPKTEEKNSTETAQNPEKVDSEKMNSGEIRPRVVVTDLPEENQNCKIIVSQDNISLLGGGGSLGILVGFEGEGDFREITATSSSPEDVEVKLETGIGESSKRLFFIVTSLNTKIGEYKITFQAPCGTKKEINVKIR
jgi:hypothetical protein